MSLITAAFLGNKAEVTKLIEGQDGEDPIDVNEPDAYGDTALHAAAYAGKFSTVEYLIEQKANVNARNGVGSTPLHKAVLSQNGIAIVNLLLQKGSDPSIRNTAGKRPEFYTERIDIANILKGDKLITKQVAVPRDRHGQLIGKQGKTLNTIRKKSGAQITVPKAEAGLDEITIRGREEEIKEAESLIEEVLKKEPAGSGHKIPDVLPDGWAATELQVKKDNIRYIIGQRGKTIQYILDKTGVRVNVPKSDNPASDKVTVVGPVDAVDEAVKIIFDVITRRGLYDD